MRSLSMLSFLAFKKNLNASKPFELFPIIRGKNSQNIQVET